MSIDTIPPNSAHAELERRLATILAADVAGYSRMMGENEEATVQTLRGHRAIFDALLKQHHGRVFNTAGDAILAEFPSAVEAVRCATEIQSALQTRNEHLPPAQKMLFRMGINLGDVVVQEGDLLGDGVNVAARIQTVAEPGGICISGSVYDQIQNKLTLQFNSLGDQTFKNIAQPIRTFMITHGESGALPVAPPRKKGESMSTSLIVAIIAASIVAGGYWFYHNESKHNEDALMAQLAVEKKAAEDSRHAAEEQSRRAADAERNAEAERLAAESAKREAELKAQAQSAEADKRVIEAKMDEQKKSLAAAVVAPAAKPGNAEAKADEQKKSLTTAIAEPSARASDAEKSSSSTGVDSANKFDGIYDGSMCVFPFNPDKRKCWLVALNVHNGTATGTWTPRFANKPAYVHITIGQQGTVAMTIEGWNQDQTPRTGQMNGRLKDNSIVADGSWENGAKLDGHWTRSP